MGAGCTKVASVHKAQETVSDNNTIIVPFNNKLSPRSEGQTVKVQHQSNKKVRSKSGADIEESNSLSKGDHIRGELNKQLNSESSQLELCGVIKREDSMTNETSDAKTNPDEGINNSSRSLSPVVQSHADKSSTMEQTSETNSEATNSTEGLKDSNANSRNDQDASQQENNAESEESSKCAGDNDAGQKEQQEEADDNGEGPQDKGDGTPDENLEDPPLLGVQDSLFFLPLDTDKPRPITPGRIPDRLQNRPRKPPLSYNERMLLADLNRFEQLDKRREFAVKRNRSVARNGKLPKINGSRDEPESGANSVIPAILKDE